MDRFRAGCAGVALIGVLATAAASVGARSDSEASGSRQAAKYCQAMATKFADSDITPALLVSYEVPPEALDRNLALSQAAYVYDNALAAIAFVACGRVSEARRIADALVAAASRDRTYRDGRIRNTYRAGRMDVQAPAPHRWRDSTVRGWIEDGHQIGSTTGNASWVAIALLTVSEAANEPRYRDTAASIMTWIAGLACGCGSQGCAVFGFPGGIDGEEPHSTALTWKSTEHNIDAYAAFAWLAQNETGSAQRANVWRQCADAALVFIAAMFDESEGRFLLGTTTDGHTLVREGSGLDTQLWPILAVSRSPAQWLRSVAWAEQHHGVAGGFDFNDDRDGLWIEGTGQAALLYKALGRSGLADQLLAEIDRDQSPGGLLYASRTPRLTTGLRLGPQSTTDDFVYQRFPHLGATAWATLAAAGWNPLTGRLVRRQS